MKEDLVTNILFYFSKLKEIKHKAYNKIGFSLKGRMDFDEMLLDLFFESNKDFHLKGEDFYEQKILVEKHLESKIEELYIYSMDNNFFYFDCPFKVYKNQFMIRKEIYLEKNIDANEKDFLLSEIAYFSDSPKNRLIGEDGFYSSYISYSDNYRLSFKRKIEFLSEKLEDFGSRIEYKEFSHFTDNMEFGEILIIEDVKIINYHSTLFISRDAQQWFSETLTELSAIDENSFVKTGFQAKVNAIFTDINCKKLIFKYGLLLKDYIGYLNKIYNANIKHKDKLSIGGNHEEKVKELIALYQNLQEANKGE